MIQGVFKARTPKDASFAFERIHDLHHATQQRVQQVSHDEAALSACHSISLYTDGSYNPRDGSLARAVVIVGYGRNAAPSAVGFLSGRLGDSQGPL